MLEKIGRAAEKAAASVPRRQFLGRLGRGAAVLSGTLGGILLTATRAKADPLKVCCLGNDRCSHRPRRKGCPEGTSPEWCSDHPDICPQ